MLDFKPPIDNKVWMAICKWGLPLETVVRSQIAVEVVGDGLERFKQLRDKHCVVVCNHSDQIDPEVMFAFSKLAGEDFYFIAAREVFEWFGGLTGLFFQHLGVYSVLRGQADFHSFQMTRDIVSNGTRKLVMFPEGEVTRQPDVVLPPRPGVMRLFLEGQGQLLQKQPGEPVLVQPMAVRWRYGGDITGKLKSSLTRIESRLKLIPRTEDLAQRVEDAAVATLTVLEHEYAIRSHPDMPFAQRVDYFRGEVLKRIAAAMDLELPEDESQMTTLRRVSKEVRLFITEDVKSKSPFQKDVHARQRAKVRHFLKDVHLIQHLIGVRERPKDRPMTQERLAYIVNKLEREVLGFELPKGKRIAMVQVGTPFSLLDYYDAFEQDPHTTVEAATSYMQARLQELVDSLDTAPGVTPPKQSAER